jgi:nucleotide-binding universal stress UspA family protein
MFEKVLVCLDGSPLAEEILPYITKEARHFTKIILLEVLNEPVVDLPIGIPGETMMRVQTKTMMQNFRKAVTEDAPAYLEKKAQPLRDKGMDVECVVLEGAPAQSIIDYAHENEIGLLAIATHGHSGFREVVMGSTAEYLLKQSGLPMLMVKPGKKK